MRSRASEEADIKEYLSQVENILRSGMCVVSSEQSNRQKILVFSFGLEQLNNILETNIRLYLHEVDDMLRCGICIVNTEQKVGKKILAFSANSKFLEYYLTKKGGKQKVVCTN